MKLTDSPPVVSPSQKSQRVVSVAINWKFGVTARWSRINDIKYAYNQYTKPGLFDYRGVDGI
jgi:hypothetical protein